MRIIVTGGAGFIGSNFVKWLLNSDESVQITNVDALTYAGNLENLQDLLDNPRHIFVKADITDKNKMTELINENTDMVINFAAESHVDRSILGADEFVRTNIQGTLNLLEVVKQQSKKIRYVQVSTDEVYGSLGNEGFFTEETPLSPNNPYSASKASADLMVRSYVNTHKMDCVITRCSNNYGPYQFPEKFIPLMISKTLKNEKIPVYGDGSNIRDWIYVEDHCRGVWFAATKGKTGEVYNFGTDNEWTNLDLVKKVLNILGKPEDLITFVGDRPGHDLRYAIDASKAEKELGWKPLVDFEKGLRQTIDWYLSNESWLNNVLSGEYERYYSKQYENRPSL